MTAGPCVYCRREMDRRGSKTSLERTADHVMPIWMRREKLYELTWAELQTILPCCWHCNQLKAGMSPGQWAAFMEANPHWWEKSEFQRRRRLVEQALDSALDSEAAKKRGRGK